MGPRTVIVGGGIAGLWIADRLVATGLSGRSIQILEKNDYIGGRILTAESGYEIGAGRIYEEHRLVCELVDRFGLTRYPMSTAIDWRPIGSRAPVPNHFEATWRAITTVFPSPPSPHHTLRDYVAGTSLESLLETFPYRTETETQRADVALPTFAPTAEFGSRAGYFGVKEGLSAIVRGLVNHLRSAGVRIKTEVEVTNIDRDTTYEIHVKGRPAPIRTERVILAIPASALLRLPIMRECEPLHHLSMAPLTRIYAEYPVDPRTGTAWFAHINRTVTDSPLRYIIPINTERGLIMISYTDGRDTTRWSGLKGPLLIAAIQEEVRRLWPELDIPEPVWMRPYEWHDGTTYWKPGDYDPAAESRRMLRPRPATMPELYVCGESFSVGRQAWVEGALEHAEFLWETHLKGSPQPLSPE